MKNLPNNKQISASVEVFVINTSDPKIKSSKTDDEPADYETAIRATGFGKYNMMLLLIGIPSFFATIFDTTTMSYVIPVARCDLNLTLNKMGTLNAITYLGMVSGGFIWGYLADTIGRKKLLVYGYLMDGIFVMLCGLSQHYTLLLISKFMTGLMINGPFAALMCYINEFHCAKHRSYIPSISGVIQSCALISLPLLGWLVFQDFTIKLFDGFITLRSWNIFLLICALPSLFSAFIFSMFPETPKFLMTIGQNDKALAIFQNIYAWNTGKPAKTYPIQQLLDEIHENANNLQNGGAITANRTKLQALKEGWQQLLPLFHPPYVNKLFIVFAMQFAVMWCANTLRLWLPQIFQAISDYQIHHGNSSEDANLCLMLNDMRSSRSNESIETICTVNYTNEATYRNNIIVWLVNMVMCLLIAAIVRIIGKKTVLTCSGICSGFCVIGLYFAKNEIAAVALASFYNTFSSALSLYVISIVVDIFPTSLRTMTISLTMVCGRTGAMLGNLTFPLLLEVGCLPPFLTISLFAIGVSLFAQLLPRTDDKALE